MPSLTSNPVGDPTAFELSGASGARYPYSQAGLTAALLLFTIPVDARGQTFLLEWKDAVRLPWGVLIPLGGGVTLAAAVDLGVHPYLLIIPTALAASYAFMMPMGAPPNALAFASGHLHVPDMAKAGFLLNLLSVRVITLFIYWFHIAEGLAAKGP